MSRYEEEPGLYERDATALVAKIEEAFAAASRPRPDQLVTSRQPDAEEVRRDFGKVHWRDLSEEVLMHHRASLVFLTPEAFRFYLPAYLRASLLAKDRTVRTEVRTYTLSALAPLKGRDPGRFERRVSLLESAERDAIRGFVALVREDAGSWRDFPATRRGSVWD